jgi:hypothetical protein
MSGLSLVAKAEREVSSMRVMRVSSSGARLSQPSSNFWLLRSVNRLPVSRYVPRFCMG